MINFRLCVLWQVEGYFARVTSESDREDACTRRYSVDGMNLASAKGHVERATVSDVHGTMIDLG